MINIKQFVKKKTNNILNSIKSQNLDNSTIIKSVAVGMYIAFSPFPGAHTCMILFSKFAFKLNFLILCLVASINNPWTMIPFYSFDYVFGYWITHDLLKLTLPWQLSLGNLFGLGKVCVISFFIGGNLLGIVFAYISYFICKRVLNRRNLVK